MTDEEKRSVNPVSLVILGWAIPGAAHVLVGRKDKALLYFVLVLGTFIAGWIISDCSNVYFEQYRWHMFLQTCTGIVAFVIGIFGEVAEPKMTGMRPFEIGTLYTTVAGLLNILVVMDAVVISVRKRRKAT